MSDPTVPKAWRWQTVLILLLVALAAAAVGVWWAGPVRAGLDAAARWAGLSDHADHDHAHTAVAVTDDSGEVGYYTCGMHPWVILPEPGDCPICHMDLTPIDPDKFTGEVAIDPVVVQNMGVRVQPVVTGPLTKAIRTVGTVAYNERAVRDVNIKTPGWIETLHVDFEGARVEAGEPLLELYSPQLYAAQQEYLLALRSRQRAEPDPAAGAPADPTDLLGAARTRLAFFDITDAQIEELGRTGEPSKTMTIRSPHTGVVIAKHANEGMKVDPGMRVFRIADLSKVWVLVTLYEYQLPYLEQGMRATMSLPYIPGQRFGGEVIYIYPYLDERTREVQVRLEFDNADGLLKPGMFANVTLENTLAAEKTLAPRSAVIDTGERQVALVSRGEGKFEPREVRLGIETGEGLVEVISGLKPGEMVVTSGQFLIDSEAKMREALAKMIRGDLAADQPATADLAGLSELETLPEPVAAELTGALGHYFAIGDALAGADGLADARLELADVSAAMQTLLMATGIPPGFGREVQVLRCPMYRAGQGGTTWLQPAGNVRNPYFGAQMLECFDERRALPVTGAGVEGRGAATEPSEAPPPAEPPAAPAPEALAAEAQRRVDAIVARYLAIQAMLTEDRWREAGDELAAIRRDAEALSGDAADTLAALAEQVAAQAAIQAGDIEGFREGFVGLSGAVLALVGAYPPAADAVPGLFHAYCPMVDKAWLQPSEAIRNPYAPYMLECGVVRGRIELRTPEPRDDRGAEPGQP